MALFVAIQLAPATLTAQAQTNASAPAISTPTAVSIPAGGRNAESSFSQHVDQANGVTANEAVASALARNGELQAARATLAAARARVRQARLRANPMLEASRAQQIGGSDNNTMVNGTLPLELGGRRSARITVAERDLEMQERLVADRERLLAAEARALFATALAEARKLRFTEELLVTTRRGYALVAARVVEGRTAPLERNMVLVEVNRMRSMREMSAGRVEVLLLELRNLMGMAPHEPLRLRGNFPDVEPLPSLAEATERALRERPDLQAARAAERLAAAQIEQARAEGRFDASLIAGYERNRMGFPVSGINEAGRLAPVMSVFHMVRVGVSLNLPVRNRNQGAIEAAVAEADAARRRREFGELTIRREVAAAYARYEAAARAREIFRVGVREQSQENLHVIRQTYELGARTLLDYIAEQRRFIELESQYIDALLETYVAQVEIERATYAPELRPR